MTMQLPVASGVCAIVDDEDWQKVIQHRWWANEHNRRGQWRVRGDKSTGGVFLANFIMGGKPPKGKDVVDHIDGNPLNNCKSNLRWVTHTENKWNRKKGPLWKGRPTLSTYKGVRVAKRRDGIPRYTAAISKDGDRGIHLGTWATEVDAARAYDRAARIMYGEYARTNFPDSTPPDEDNRLTRTVSFGFGLAKKKPNWGVTFTKRKKYDVRFMHRRKIYWGGTFDNLEDAIAARNKLCEENGLADRMRW